MRVGWTLILVVVISGCALPGVNAQVVGAMGLGPKPGEPGAPLHDVADRPSERSVASASPGFVVGRSPSNAFSISVPRFSASAPASTSRSLDAQSGAASASGASAGSGGLANASSRSNSSARSSSGLHSSSFSM